MNVRPLHDRVLIERLSEESKSEGGIILTGNAAKKSNRGVVKAVGAGKLLENGQHRPPAVQVGDTVLFKEGFSAHTEKQDEKEYLIVQESDILAVIDA
ncbi:co-chaperone GroES [Pontibacterium sp.]|uniref:co-chaperone GroES n=1 Tax=Pontibacterium sp. TaxID=2036026 RepID=UPI003518CF4C